MNKRVKKLWIADLRSGEIEQAQGRLRDKNGRCCLGVLCDVFKRETHKGRWLRDKYGDWQFVIDGTREEFVLPAPVMNWAKLERADPEISSLLRAAQANDNGQDFKQIADRIEKYL